MALTPLTQPVRYRYHVPPLRSKPARTRRRPPNPQSVDQAQAVVDPQVHLDRDAPADLPVTSPKKLFIVRKYVMAESVADAVRIEGTRPVDDCFVDDDWKKSQPDNAAAAFGFSAERRRPPKKTSRKHGKA